MISSSAESFSEVNPFMARLASNGRQTSSDHFQDTRLVEFDVSTSGGGLDYEPGDVCMVMPRNSKENVEAFFELFSSLKREDRMWLDKADTFELPPQSQLPQVQSVGRVTWKCKLTKFHPRRDPPLNIAWSTTGTFSQSREDTSSRCSPISVKIFWKRRSLSNLILRRANKVFKVR